MNVKAAIRRMRQRSKLPAGGRIVRVPCAGCNQPIFYWSGDPIANLAVSTARCSYCITAERAYRAAIFAKH